MSALLWQNSFAMTVEFAESLYSRELDRRTQLDGAPTVRIAALAILGGVFSFYVSRYKPTGVVLPWFFLICTAGAIAFGVLAAIWMLRSYAGYRWQQLSNPVKLLEYNKQLKAVVPVPAEADDTFEQGLIEKLIAAAAHNSANNNARSELMYYASIFIAWTFAFTMLAGIPVMFQALANWPWFG